MLRGPQTPGELKQRADRMHPFADLGAIGVTLTRLIDRRLVARLDRRPGQKEERYRELLGDDAQATTPSPTAEPTDAPMPPEPDRMRPPAPDFETRLARVERAVAELGGERLARLERELAALRDALGG
jgi:uncharacterized protein YceH (UPF0502 family)